MKRMTEIEAKGLLKRWLDAVATDEEELALREWLRTAGSLPPALESAKRMFEGFAELAAERFSPRGEETESDKMQAVFLSVDLPTVKPDGICAECRENWASERTELSAESILAELVMPDTGREISDVHITDPYAMRTESASARENMTAAVRGDYGNSDRIPAGDDFLKKGADGDRRTKREEGAWRRNGRSVGESLSQPRAVLRRVAIWTAAAAILGGGLAAVEYGSRPYCYINGKPVRDVASAMETTVYLEQLSEFGRSVDALDRIFETNEK